MDLKKISKMLDKGYGTEDSSIAKQILISHFPELKKLVEERQIKHVTKVEFKKLGIDLDFIWNAISFPKHEFPELWEKQQQ